MKKLGLVFICLLSLVGLYSGQAMAAAGELASLRGIPEIEETNKAHELKKYIRNNQPIERDYVQQPPLIPHKIEGYQVNLNFNKCLDCHSWSRYKEAGATKISLTHFKDRAGNELADVSARRYFCTQCHVPQADAKPLVENQFQPVRSLKR